MTKDQVPARLQKWFDYEFSSGCYTGDDFKKFEKDFWMYAKSALPGVKIRMHKNHYEFVMVLSKELDGKERYVYLAISDVRFFRNEWADNILVRAMEHPEDWTGGSNNYCTLNSMHDTVEMLFKIAP